MAYSQRRCFRLFPKHELYIAQPQSPRYIPHGFLAVAFLQGFSMGSMFALLGGLGQAPVFLVHFGALVTALCLLVFTSMLSKLAFNNLIFRFGFPLLATGFFLVALIPSAPIVGSFFQYLSYGYLYLIMCCLCAYLGRVHRQSAIWVVGLSTGFLFIGQLIGEFIGRLFTVEHTVSFAIVMSFALLLLAGILSGTDIAFGWGTIRPGARERSGEAMNIACEILMDEYRLSNRERDVFVLLLKGRTRKYVSGQLDVSEETVKSHTKHIYNKLGVHSHTELI
jgi:DNA-binding CsgD family transcriptional regulator